MRKESAFKRVEKLTHLEHLRNVVWSKVTKGPSWLHRITQGTKGL